MIDQSSRIIIGPHESMPEFLGRFAATSGNQATVVIPVASSLLLTASEFRALKAAADQRQLRVIVETDDRLRKQLSTMFGMPAIDMMPAPVPGAGPVNGDVDQSTSGGMERIAAEPEPEPAFVPPRSTKAAHTPARTAESFARATAPIELEEDELPPPRPGFPFKWFFAGLASLGVLAVTVLIAAFMLQSATIELTLARQPITSEVTFAVVAAGETTFPGGAFQLPGETVTFTVPFTASMPVTGAIRNQIDPATGQVQLRNPAEHDVTIASGTRFSTYEGPTFAFTADVTVPAAGADGPGKAVGQIASVTGGEAANKSAGTLSGKLDNGVYFMNRDGALTGGTDTSTPAVAQADIDALIAQADARLPELARSFTLPDGRGIVPGSVRTGGISYTADHKPGDAATTVTIQASMVASGLAFSLASAEHQAGPQLLANLRANVPPSSLLDEGSVVIAPTGDNPGAGLVTLRATGQVRPVWSPEKERQIANAIAGESVADARSYIASLPGVASVTIEAKPGFLPMKIPRRPGRITVHQR